jgi:prolyl-tRNA synthetase
MRQTQLFTKTKKLVPKDETSKNAELLIRGGFAHKEMAGVYSFLPLGLRVLNKIENIVREEMNKIGGQEIRMATLHPSEPWKKTGGWDNIDVLFKLTSRTENEYAIGQSEEEIITPLVKEHIFSYRDLPLAVYQIGQKYRDELRAKSGILRGREFGMKDMYSFHASQADLNGFYEIVKKSYFQIFESCGLRAKATEASGGNFSEKISYEFMVLTDAGEDDILYCDVCDYCVNVEIAKTKEGDMCSKCQKDKLQKARASEVGNVFDLGQKYVKDFNFTYMDEAGVRQYPVMGCYGLGTTRLMGVVVEALSDQAGIVWPESIAPFRAHLLSLGANEKAEEIYKQLVSAGVEVLYDDRDAHAGEKFADSDLIGIPYRVVVSKRALESGIMEIKRRTAHETEMVPLGELSDFFKRAQ